MWGDIHSYLRIGEGTGDNLLGAPGTKCLGWNGRVPLSLVAFWRCKDFGIMSRIFFGDKPSFAQKTYSL